MNVETAIKRLQKCHPKAILAVQKKGGGIRLVKDMCDDIYYDGTCTDKLPKKELDEAPTGMSPHSPELVTFSLHHLNE